MKPILIEKDYSNLVNNFNDIGIGKKLYIDCNFEIENIDSSENNVKIYSKIENNLTFLKVINSEIGSYECQCDSYKFNSKICKHIICQIEIYNECIKHNIHKYKNIEDLVFHIRPILYKNKKNEISIKVETEFVKTGFFSVEVSNISNLFKESDKYFFFFNFYFDKNQIDSNSLILLNEFKDLISSTNVNAYSKSFDINLDYLDDWFNFFKKNNIQFSTNNKHIWNLTFFNFNREKYDWEVSSNLKPNINSKKKYILKVKDEDYFSFVTKEYVYLLIYKQNKYLIQINQYKISKEKDVACFIRNINKNLSKNDFYNLYLSIKNLFWNAEKIISSIFVMKNNLNKIDPILEIKIFLHEKLEVLVAKLSFIYGENVYPYNLNETNYFKRERFLEKKLLDDALVNFPDFNKNEQVFEMIDHQKFYDFLDWSNKKKNDEYFKIKISENLVFKNKKRKKFIINSTNLKNNFLEINWKIDGFSEQDTKLILDSYINKKKFVKLSNNTEININSEINFDDFVLNLNSLNSNINDIENNTIKISKHYTNYLIDKSDESSKKNLLKYYDDLYNYENIKSELPLNLNMILKEYQIKGYKWIKNLIKINASGILADEMGLGKTLQSICILADIYFNKKTNKTSLIICPSSLVYNWSDELKKYAPFINFVVIDGDQNQRKNILKNIDKYDLIITSYNLLNKDLQFYLEYEFYLEILDEAQKIKNQLTQFSRDVKSINSLYKLALTGTPIENNLSELWSIFDFLMPGFLHEYKNFKKLYEDKLLEKDDSSLQDLKIKIKPFILRREKKDVLKELPKKSVKTLISEFDEEQKKLYFAELNRSKLEIDKNNISSVQIFSILTKLRQICCSPKLVYENSVNNGSKFKLCMNLITDLISNGNKILLFSQFTKMIEIFEKELTLKKIKFLTLTGNLAKKERQDLVSEFNNKPNIKIFLISLKAGSVGLTLTSANTVIHYDPWWNSSLENQATDRAHRIGQNKNVNIYKLISKNSIEEKVLNLQNAKTEIFNKLFHELNEPSNSKVSIKEMLNLLDIE